MNITVQCVCHVRGKKPARVGGTGTAIKLGQVIIHKCAFHINEHDLTF